MKMSGAQVCSLACADFVCWAEWENEKTSVDVITSLEAVLETVQVPLWNANL